MKSLVRTVLGPIDIAKIVPFTILKTDSKNILEIGL